MFLSQVFYTKVSTTNVKQISLILCFYSPGVLLRNANVGGVAI
jgi:hypothetical protein